MPPLSVLAWLAVACVRPSTRPDVSAPERLYTLGYGDSLWGVATAYDVPGGYPAIARANGIRDPDRVYAGDKLTIQTHEPSLPRVAQWSEAPKWGACAMQAAAAWSSSAPGCTSLRCVDTGAGSSVCACPGAQPHEDALVVATPRAAPERIPLRNPTPWWYEAGPTGEPERSAETLLGAKVQLDADAPLETIVSWRTHLGDVGMSQGVGLIVDHDGTAGPVMRLDHFGVGSAVQAGNHCDVLATEWELADESRTSGWGYYLTARRFGFADGALVPQDTGLVVRRLRRSFVPTFTPFGTGRVGAPSIDLGGPGARTRSTEPLLEAPVIATQAHTIRAAKREHGVLIVDLDGTETRVDPEGGEVLRLGDRSSGRLYPAAYAPGNDRSLRGRTAELRYYRTVWGEAFAVLWV